MLTKSQLKFLKKLINTGKYYYPDSESQIVSYLYSLGYAGKSSENGDTWGKGAIWYCYITEKGKAYIYDVRKTNMRFFIHGILYHLRTSHTTQNISS